MGQDVLGFLAGMPEAMIEELYERWLGGEELAADWQRFFAAYQLGMETGGTDAACCHNPSMALKHSGVQSLIYRYRDLGHLLACTDPLSPCPVSHPLLDLSAFGLDESDLDTRFTTGRHHLRQATLREFLHSMRETYGRDIGIEFMHIQEPGERQWLIDRMEPGLNRPLFAVERKLRIMEMLNRAVLFEAFLHRRFQGQKRFSLEGGEALIPLIDGLVQACPDAGISDLVLGMSHRGRLNVLAHIFGKPYTQIFAEFRDSQQFGFIGDGDVKYHKGYSVDRQIGKGALHLTLAANPSHLEAVDPVVEGKARARQDRIGRDGAKKVLPVLIHGDAAFAGQGMVAEVLNMSQLESSHTGGTLHLVVNNQIGFTTLPKDSRSTRYSTDVAKMLACPIFHVHGERPEAAVHAMELALAYRQAFCRDVVLELICYRRHGHNEGDEPAFTQPVMYRRIAERPSVNRIYAERLAAEGIEQARLEAMVADLNRELEQSLLAPPPSPLVGFKNIWSGFEREYRPFEEPTGIAGKRLQELAREVTTLPSTLTPHPKIATLLKKRLESVLAGSGIDWGTAETLAYASLLDEKARIRISGQDVRRGTFNHRHAAVYNQEDGAVFIPLAELAARQGAVFDIFDSCLSENGVLGFEYGYSLENPKGLTIWEAQFGDFANGAQVIIDQFIAAGETKWNRASGLVMLLPHGYEGQGAEHSSARIERYLQLCAKNNLLVTMPSTPAQMFHLLRRQVRQPFRKPLIVFTPKSLLRNPVCVSTLDELSGESRFHEILVTGDVATARRIIFCSGKIFHELSARITADKVPGIALVRLEQLYPLRSDLLKTLLANRRADAECCWVQEEPENMGGWRFMRPLLEELTGPLRYIGREADSCPAVGSHHLHNEQQQAILTAACA